MVLGAALRFTALATQSFDGDELYTAWLVRQPFGGMVDAIPETESTPYLYYALAWVWTRVFGDGEAGLRSLSALAGVLTVPAAFVLARRALSERVGVAAAALVAASPLLVWFSQQARAYALLTLLLTVGAAAFVARAPRAWAVLSALALATHYFAAFLVVPQALWLVRTRCARAWALLPLATLVALVPLAWAQRHNPGGIEDAGLASRIAQVPKTFLVGFKAPAELVVAVAALVLVAVALVGLARLPPESRRGASVLALLAAALVVPPIALALAGLDLMGVRNVVPALVPVLVLIAAAGLATRVGTVALAGLVVLGVAVVIKVDTDARLQRTDWRGATRALGAAPKPRAVVARTGVDAGPLSVYLPGVRAFGSEPPATDEIALIGLAAESTFSGGTPEPPRPPTPIKAPPGFRETWRRETDTYTVIRLTARRPRRLNLYDLLTPDLGGEKLPALYLQLPEPP